MLVEAENSEQLAEESFRGDFKRFGRWLKDKRYIALIVCLWAAVLSSVTIWEYYSLYEKYPSLKIGYVVALAPTYSQYSPRLYTLDYIIVLVASVLAGFAIADIEYTLWGFLICGILSTQISVVYSTFFIWYMLGFGSTLGSGFITTIMWAAFLNVFRMIFPLALLITFLGSICGCFFRYIVQPSTSD
jgi:hypothetical protein